MVLSQIEGWRCVGEFVKLTKREKIKTPCANDEKPFGLWHNRWCCYIVVGSIPQVWIYKQVKGDHIFSCHWVLSPSVMGGHAYFLGCSMSILEWLSKQYPVVHIVKMVCSMHVLRFHKAFAFLLCHTPWKALCVIFSPGTILSTVDEYKNTGMRVPVVSMRMGAPSYTAETGIVSPSWKSNSDLSTMFYSEAASLFPLAVRFWSKDTAKNKLQLEYQFPATHKSDRCNG